MNRSGFLMALGAGALFAYDAGAIPVPSCCRDTPNWYAGLSGFAVFLNNSDITHPEFTLASGTDTQTFKVGYGFSGQFGYRVFPNIRTELEIADRINDISSDGAQAGINPGGKTSDQRSLAVMANIYYDYHNKWLITPYVGAGIGEAQVKNARYYINEDTGAATGKLSAWTMAYQFMAGVSYEIPNFITPMEVSLGYRYFTGTDAKTTISGVPGTITFPNDSHNLELGGRMYF